MSRPASHLVNRIIRAGAGAGKTTDLVARVLSMAQEFKSTQGRFPHLVVTTFTRKATQELKERLMAEAMDKNDAELIDFVQRPSHLHISTIHGVLSLYLTRFGSELGLGGEFSLISSRESLRLRKRVFRGLLRSHAEFASQVAQLLETLDLNQLLDVLDQYYSLYCQGQAIRCLEDEFEVLYEQGKQKLQTQLSELVDWISREACSDKWLEYGKVIERLLQQLRPLRRLEAISLIGTHLEETTAPRRSSKGPSVELGAFRKAIEDEMKDLVGFCWSDEYFMQHKLQAESYAQLAATYSDSLLNRKIETGLLTIADLELLAVKLLNDYPETGELFSREWDYWLIDEYQDTSPLQIRLLKGLIGQRKSFVVGDPQQSIYLFRGARSEVFIEKEEQLRQDQSGFAEVSELMTNYRSRAPLLKFFNSLFTAASSRQFSSMQVGYHKQLSEPEVECAHFFRCADKSIEIDVALARVLELQAKGVALEKICVLSRANEALYDLARKAQAHGVPVQVHASAQFSRRREVQDALSLLKFLVNPYDDVNLLVLLRSPWFKVPDVELMLIQPDSKSSYYLRLLRYFKNSDEESPLWQLKNLLDQAGKQGLVSTWRQALQTFQFFDYTLAIDTSGRREANLWKLVSLASELERLPGASVLEFIDELGGAINLESDGDGDATPVIEPKRVNLMTVHASKGLQFEYVIALGLGKKLPSPRTSFFMVDSDSGKWTLSLQDPEEKKWIASPFGTKIKQTLATREALESERVFYVALTRAMLGVTLIWSEVSEGSWAQLIPAELLGGGQEFGCIQRDPISVIDAYLKPASSNSHFSRGLVQVREKWQEPARGATRQTTSVTNMVGVGGAALTADKEFRTWDYKKALDKAIQGVELHRHFEALKYHESNQGHSTKIQQAIEFVKTWNGGLLQQIIHQGEVEWGFALALPNEQLLQGQIDLWGQVGDQVWVVDYKTGALHFSNKAFEQLQVYASALRRMGYIAEDRIAKLAVVYPLQQQVLVQDFTADILPKS